MKLELVTRRDVSYVELKRDKKHSLGFTIKDGTQEDARPVVKCVKVNSPAEKSLAVSPGDVILSINDSSTTGKKIKDVRRMLDDAGSNVNLKLQYKTYETRIQGSSIYRKQQLTVRLQKIKGSFGFLLRKCSKYSLMMEYPMISNIKEGSPIHKRGHVQDGDRLLMIDNISLSWMSLAYIASLLEARDEAEFTFEYNVGMVNFSEMDTKLDLEIDTPVADLGLSFRMCDKECSVMYISNIRKGSVAERCGVFSEGDVVSSINGKDTSCLTISKAYFLLRKVKKRRKILFILNRQEAVGTSKRNTSVSSEDTASTESFISDIRASDWKHMNTPVSSSFKFMEHQKYNFQNFCYAEQIRSMDKFESILSTMSSLKQTLSALTCQAFKETSLDQNCNACKNAKHAVKLCTSCLARMNVKCAQSMDALRELVAHFIKFSSNMLNENDDQLVNISLRNVIHMLRETLPNIFCIPELQDELTVLAEKIASADISCSVCDKEVKTAMMISKQLLLVLSITDNSEEFTDLTEHLVRCLLNIKFPCFGGDSGYSLNSNSSGKQSSFSANFSESVCIGIDENLSSDTASSHLKNNSEASSDKISLESNFDTLQLETEICHDYLKLTHIQSTSESKNSVSLESVTEFNRIGEIRTENNILPKEAFSETHLTSFLSEDIAGKKSKKIFKNERFPKIWNSLDSLKNVKSIPNFQSLTQNSNQSTISSQDETFDTTKLNQNVSSSESSNNIVADLNQTIVINQCKNCYSDKENASHSSHNKHKGLDATNKICPASVNYANKSIKTFNNFQKSGFSRKNVDSNEDIITDVNSESTSSSSRFTAKKRNSVAVKKTNPETMRVTLKKDGVGFGLGISDKLVISELPVINAIEPKSASHKIGLLKLGDRILGINAVNISKLTSRQFSSLKNKALAAETITLTVEFDVCDEKYKFGLFDVVLEKSLSLGLIFEDLKKDSAMIVKGIEKGSAAHRSGQIFPTDQVTHVKYKKNEDFDPYTSSFSSEQNIIITVMRDPKRILEHYRANKSVHKTSDIRVPNPSPCYTNPCFQREEDLTRSRQNFDVKKTAVHSSRKNSLVVDHEVTLYRDSLTFDFGILLSEDPATGRAYVSGIRPDGPAHKSGVIKKLDRIIEVNGMLVSGNVDNSVLDLLSRANHKVDLLVRRVFREDRNVT